MIGFLIVSVIFLIWTPPIGIAIGVLGAVAAIMALRGEMHGGEKVLWTSIIFTLLFVEVRAIDKDQHEKAEDRWAANRHFQHIAGEVESVIAQNQKAIEINQQDFRTTLERFSDSANMITGGNTSCYLDIFPVAPEKNAVNHAASMAVKKVGKYPLHGITVTITDNARYSKYYERLTPSQLSAENSTMMDRAAEASTLREPIRDFATPELGINPYYLSDEAGESFSILFFANNGYWLERLELRRLGPDKWVKAMWVEAPSNPYYVRIDKDYPRKKQWRVGCSMAPTCKNGRPCLGKTQALGFDERNPDIASRC
jgi:hypothetical protein